MRYLNLNLSNGMIEIIIIHNPNAYMIIIDNIYNFMILIGIYNDFMMYT